MRKEEWIEKSYVNISAKAVTRTRTQARVVVLDS